MYKCIIFGGSGNIGRTVVDNLLKNEKYIKITIFSRKILERWKNNNKLNLMQIESLDFLSKDNFIEEFNKKIGNEKDYNTIFCCLGGRDDTEYEKIDYQLSIKISDICEKLSIAHLSIISTENSDENSKDNFLKFRGKMEEEICNKNIKCISIFKTNYVIYKEDPSFFYCIISFFYRCKNDSIECKNLGKAMVVNDLEILEHLRQKGDEESKKINRYTNNDIKRLALKKI